MKCEICGREVSLPFRCQYCGSSFCSEHRLPENHQCPQIELTWIRKDKTRPPAVRKQKPDEHEFTYTSYEKGKNKLNFSNRELIHLAIATMLVLGVGLSYLGLPTLFLNGYVINYTLLVLFVTIFTVSFFLHEIAHKIVAQKEGYWAEFRLTFTGAVLTLLSILPTFIKIISPGAVMIGGFADRRSIGKIAVAGPIMNVILSAIFLGATFLFPRYGWIFLPGIAFNAWIALFNLIPFGMFDGFKVFLWNKRVWALSFAASLILTVFSYRSLI